MSSDIPEAPASRCPFLAKLEAMPRLTEARYADGLGELYQGADPVAVAQTVFDQDGSIPDPDGVNTLFTTWGQFLDHDLSLTPEGEHEVIDNDAFPHGVGRSEFLDGTGEDGPRAFGNVVTPEIDASMVYGSTEGREWDLRAHEGGRLLTQDDPNSIYDLMPEAGADHVMAGNSEDKFAYLAGDIRANENPNLTAMHTLWVREHNHWADRIAQDHPDWTDQQIFEAARGIVEYEIQTITYGEYLPQLLGDAAPTDLAYDATVEGQISLEFSTAAFRFGHTMVASSLEVRYEDGSVAEGGHLALMDTFFNPQIVAQNGIDELFRGMGHQSAEALDTKVVDDLNFFLATPQGVQGFSLPALNLMRAADHGMGSYVDVRAQLLGDIDPTTLDPTDFSIITADPAVQADLAAVYPSVHDVDLWVGGLAEDPAAGGMVGPTFSHIIAGQFQATAQADATFASLPDDLSPEILADLRAGSRLADVIIRNTEIDHVEGSAFQKAQAGLTDVEPAVTDGADAVDLVSNILARGLATGAGDDTVTSVGGSRIEGDLDLGAGDDVAMLSSGRVTGDLLGGAGDDRIALTGTARVDGRLQAGDGADTVTLDEMATVRRIDLGDGDDRVTVSAPGAHILKGGDGHDTLRVANGRLIFDEDEDGEGLILWDDGGSTRFEAFEEASVVPCFTPGTLVVTAAGKRPIESLRPGARVLTLDDGLQPVRWIGRTRVAARGRFAPVRIAAGALANTRALTVSPQHRMVLASAHAALLFGAADVLAPALALIGRPGVTRPQGGTVDYIHLMFDRHQIVLAEGIPSESFRPGPLVLSAMDRAVRDEVLALFPDLAQGADGQDARPALRGREARLLASLL